MMESRFENKTALITGGAKGIGRATVLRFIREGGRAAVIDAEPEDSDWVNSLKRELGNHADRLLYLTADVTDETATKAAVEQAIAGLGHVDMLVNNVGMGANPTAIEDLGRADWDRFMTINVTSAFLVTSAVLPGMRARGKGRIVNLASVAGRSISKISNLPYSTAKAAIMGFTRKLAFEEGPNGIAVNAVAPGTVFTERVKARYDGLETADRDSRLSAIPLGRAAQPAEIAAAILFLGSDDASYITGTVLDVNGGSLMA